MIKSITPMYFITALLLTVISPSLQAQTIQATPVNLINDITPATAKVYRNVSGMGKLSTCGVDTVDYTWYKTPSGPNFLALSLNTATSGNVFAQWFPADQPTTVSGFTFYAWQSAGISASVTLTCRMYLAGPDSLPLGLPMASATVTVDSSFGGGLLSNLLRQAVFPAPVTTSSAYVITVETSSSTNVSVISNNWNSTTSNQPNGRGEWLSSVKIGNTFVRGYNVNVGGVIYDADFIFQPYVSYSFDADFTISSCNSGGNQITFTNTTSPVFFSRFYNRYGFFNIAYIGCQWDYGDSSGLWTSLNGQRQYNYAIPYTVRLKDTLYGWRTGCVDVETKTVGIVPPAPAASNNGPLCNGATLRLYADTIPGATYYWTGPNGFTSPLQNPSLNNVNVTAIGNYQVQAIISGCTSTVATTYVNVISSLAASSNAPICAGQNLNLSVNHISGATYSWTGPNGFTSTQSSPSITAASVSDSGLYSVSVSMAGCGNMGPFTVLGSVNRVPDAPVAGSNGPLCVGDNLNLTASSYPNGAYTWSGPNNFISNQQNPTRTSAQSLHSGTYSVTVTANGCNSPQGSVTVIVNNVPPAPVAGNNGPLCNSQSLSLTATTVSNATYSWSGPNNFTSASQNPVRTNITTLDAGTYSVTATLNGCTSPTATTSVVITTNTPTPVISHNGPLCPGQTFQLSASAIAGATYSWTGPNNFTSSLQNPAIDNVDANDAGIYSVTATTTACGTSSAGSATLVVNSLPTAPAVGNNGPLCDGSSINLTASDITGATYHWTGANGFTSDQQNPVIPNANASNEGEYSVFVSVPGCGSSPASSTIVKLNRIPPTPSATSNGAVCTGDSIKLSGMASQVGPNVVYRWTGPNNYSASGRNVALLSANTNHAGTYELTVTDSNCTSSAATTSVTIKSLPASPSASSNSPLCDGGTLLLNATAVPGATYQWNGVNGFKSGSQNPVFSGVNTSSSGSYEVVAIVDGCRSLPATANVQVNALPSKPVVSDSIMKCLGQNAELTAQSSQGVTYSWSGPGGFTSSQQNISFSDLRTSHGGVYQVIASTNLCSSLPSSTKLIVNLPPAAPVLTTNPAGNACVGDSIQLFASFLSDATYEWTGPAGFGSSVQRPIIYSVNSAHSGAYTATVTRYGCTSPAGSVSVTVNPLPVTGDITGPETAQQNEIQSYSVTGPATSTYTWTMSSGGTVISGENTSSVNVRWAIITTSASIRVFETSLAGCKGETRSLTVNVVKQTGMSNAEFTQGNVSVYPNPASREAVMELDLNAGGTALITFTDMLGREVMKDSRIVSGRETFAYDVSLLNKGVYFINLSLNGELKVLRLVVN